MIPMKTSSVFKSRWIALLWAAGIIWFAYDFAASEPQPDPNAANAAANSDAVNSALDTF